MRVDVFRGIPGSGKSTRAKKIAANTGAIVVSADDYYIIGDRYQRDPRLHDEAHQDCWRRFYEAMFAHEHRIIIDNTNITVNEIGAYVLPARAMGYIVNITTFQVDVEIGLRRNKHQVPEEVVRDKAAKMILHDTLFPADWPHKVINTNE